MTDRYKPNGTPLSAHEREILDILQEECAEVILAASKLLRFGKEDVPGTGLTNTAVLGLEIGDLQAMVDRVDEVGIVRRDIIGVGYQRKIDRLKYFMQTDAPVDKLAERNRG